jgi:hypothetical protein
VIYTLLKIVKSTHSTPRSEARGMLRVDTERRFLPRFENRGLASSNVSKGVKIEKRSSRIFLYNLDHNKVSLMDQSKIIVI